MVLPAAGADGEFVLTTRPTGAGAPLESRLAEKMDPLFNIVRYLQYFLALAPCLAAA
jgi:hypothetical protein